MDTDTGSAPAPPPPPTPPTDGGGSESPPEAAGSVPTASVGVREIAAPLHRARGWMRFVGLAEIVSGLALAATVVGLLAAWIPVWAGVVLLKAAGNARRAVEDSAPEALAAGLRQLHTFFVLSGVQALLLVATIVTSVLVGGAAISSFLGALAP